MVEDHEGIKLENLRLMLHFKTEYMNHLTVIDGLIKTLEASGNNMTEMKHK
jgi:sensor histidine kinase regulating citrate/malate metabolism